ncbi:MBL fold metallo-hydrolase [Celeribacter arenosi]|uniref:MBL fold metallo-hydrolase n=1 Tax=Celeribacter arenosi TaxID=792649 RepID=A0ABP7K8F0_9RHOB
MRQATTLIVSTFLCFSSIGVTSGTAQESERDRIPSHCRSLANDIDGGTYIWRAALTDPLPDHTVRIKYIDHAMFVVQAGEIEAVTDFNGYFGVTDWVPDVVTMNQAHSSHYTSRVDDRVTHVLEGWGRFAEGAEHNLDLGPMLIRNVPTDIRMGDGREPNGNSVFIFEAGGLCIGHLGHLHHEPSEEQYAAIGRLDVVMAPVDGGLTVPRETMVKIVSRLRSSIVIPMHWFSRGGLNAFLQEMSTSFTVIETGTTELLVSLDRLPSEPTIMVLEPQFIED